MMSTCPARAATCSGELPRRAREASPPWSSRAFIRSTRPRRAARWIGPQPAMWLVALTAAPRLSSSRTVSLCWQLMATIRGDSPPSVSAFRSAPPETHGNQTQLSRCGNCSCTVHVPLCGNCSCTVHVPLCGNVVLRQRSPPLVTH